MILVFAGAGASYAVDCKQYPTTVEFFRRLPEEITKKPWFAAASQFLDTSANGEPKDIEKLLGVLSEMEEFCKKSVDPNTISGRMLQPGYDRLRKVNPQSRSNLESGHHRILVDTLREDQVSIERLRDEINAQVYRFYAEVPDPKKLHNWTRLLRLLTEAPQVVQIFTTNYDLVIESAISEAGLDKEIATGRDSDGFRTRLDLDYWDTQNELINTQEERGLLTKLHGSVDWQRGSRGEIVMGPPRFTEVHQNHIVLYPGHKGEPREEPFIAFHRHLRSIAERAKAAFFIGYSFGDDHINEILSNFMAHVPTYAINKKREQDKLEFLYNVMHFDDGFTDEAVNKCFGFLLEHDLIHQPAANW